MRRTRWIGGVVLVTLLALPPAAGAAAGNLYAFTANSPGELNPFDIGTSGALTARTPASISTIDKSVYGVTSPDGRRLYVSALNGAPGSIGLFDIAPDGGLTAKSPASVPVGNGGIGATVSPDGRTLYATNRGDGTTSIFGVGADGSLTPKSPPFVATGAQGNIVALSPDGKSAYIPHLGASHFVSQWDVGAGGTLTPKAPATVPAGTDNGFMVISPNGRNAYVSASTTNAVHLYDIDGAGRLVAKSPATVAVPQAGGLAISADGRSLYVRGNNLIAQFDVGADGGLTSKSPATVAITGPLPTLLGLAPDGRSLYTTDGGNHVLQFDVGANGTLSAKPQPTVNGGPALIGLAVRANQGPTAAFSASPGVAGSASSFDGSGSSDPETQVGRYDWDFGDGSTASNGGAKPSHVYTQPGTYTAKLTVTDDQGCSASQVFNGLATLCNGTTAATTTRTIAVGSVAPTNLPVVCCALPPSSAFTIVALTATRGGTITAVIDTQAAGAATGTGTARVSKPRRRRKRKARNAATTKLVAYGTGTASIASAGRLTLRIPATRSASAALKRARKLHVAVSITFAAGGPETTNTRSVTVKAAEKRKHRR
jgi:6-phosphogluconolactonase (cycloisomerase 2 family)